MREIVYFSVNGALGAGVEFVQDDLNKGRRYARARLDFTSPLPSALFGHHFLVRVHAKDHGRIKERHTDG
jgi:hypothetical protein